MCVLSSDRFAIAVYLRRQPSYLYSHILLLLKYKHTQTHTHTKTHIHAHPHTHKQQKTDKPLINIQTNTLNEKQIKKVAHTNQKKIETKTDRKTDRNRGENKLVLVSSYTMRYFSQIIMVLQTNIVNFYTISCI